MLTALKKFLRMSDDDRQVIGDLTAEETATLVALMTKIGIDETVLRDLVAGVDKDEPAQEPQEETLAMSVDAITKRLDGFEKRLSAIAGQKRDVPKAGEKESPKGYFDKLKAGEFCR